MSVCLLKEMLHYENYKIIIIEAKEFLLDYFDISSEMVINQAVDTRVLTGIVEFNENILTIVNSKEKLECDYILFTYDYHELIQGNSVNRAILFHELAHIYYPPESIQEEILCDLYSSKKVDLQSVYDYLQIAIKEMKKINKSTKDLEIRELFIKSLL